MSVLPATSHGASPYLPTILLAEDDEESRSLLVRVLSADGYRVIPVRNGTEALDHILSARGKFRWTELPDLVVSDINMPGLSGTDVASVLRHDRKPLPFIFITAFGSEETRERARWLDAAAVIDKPFDIDVLLTEIRRQLEVR
ncbi:MAG: response regulator [Polyangiaceae bacterium]|nr:response regulator [Polyangiaceae bacterium]